MVVVDLAVADDDDTATLVDHRLRATLEASDRQTCRPEHGGAALHGALVVRTTVRHRLHHGRGLLHTARLGPEPLPPDRSGDSAHQSRSCVGIRAPHQRGVNSRKAAPLAAASSFARASGLLPRLSMSTGFVLEPIHASASSTCTTCSGHFEGFFSVNGM